jgi:hypothetical protein
MPATEIPPPPLLEGETSTQLELMRAGEPYIAMDPYLHRLRQLGQDKVYEINKEVNLEKRMELFTGWAGLPEGADRNVYIMSPFMA